MLNGPFSPWPSFSKEEADAVSHVLLSNKVNYWTGQEGRLFEKEFAAFAGTKHAIAVANGTVALDLALQGLGIGDHFGGNASDEVIVTPRSFVASASAIVNAGARPVFADVDPETGNISPETVAHLITANTRAILCVHLAGWPCDMDGMRQLIGSRDIRLIEDCAQAHGARYKGRPVGGLGDVAAWSFCQDKIMTTGGEGGTITCHDEALWKRMWAYKDHGKSWDAVYERSHPPGFRWLHESMGTNWRMTEMQSAIGRIQLRRIVGWQAAREDNAARLIATIHEVNAAFGNVLRPPPSQCPSCAHCSHRCIHAWYKFYTHIHPEALPHAWTRDRIVAEIVRRGVPAMQGSCSEVYLERAFDGTGLRPKSPLPVARELGETSIMFLVHPTLKKEEMDLMCSTIADVFADMFAENRVI